MIDIELQYSYLQSELFFPEKFFPKYTIAPKGRRGGLTKGAANAFIEYGFSVPGDFWFLPDGDLYFMWGDTVVGNINRYVDRYFKPELKKFPASMWKWNKQDKIMECGRATIDFRSADRPENWEGFGYHIIFLNEAGIILEDDYLFNNAVLPMLMDYPDARLIAAGVPKGKRHKNGPHKYYELYQKALVDHDHYRIIKFTGRNNPFINRAELELIAQALDELNRKQEIDGEFIDILEKKYLYTFSDRNVIKRVDFEPNPHLPLLISFDFNVEPQTATIGQDQGARKVIFDFIKIPVGSTEEVCEEIIVKYMPKWKNWIDVTGDATGHNREKVKRGNITAYKLIMKMLGLKDNNLKVPRQNKAHKDSRQLCCSVCQHADFFITDNCVEVINDCKDASVDETGELIKSKEQGRHFFDNVRYTIHEWYRDFIDHPERYK